MLFSDSWKGFPGDAIQVSDASGGTSGRFQVAKAVARIFPAYREFAENVISEGVEPAGDFPSGPYPRDKLTYRGKNIVEFETPANAEGLGTQSHLKSNDAPIRGVAMITGEDTDLILLTARLPETDRDLMPFIIGLIERDESVKSQ
jgi:hypothetical protein